jgi:cell division septation protein DedD
MKAFKPEYLEKVKLLATQEKERLLSRMGGKLPRKLDRRKISMDEALALQLEIEDELLNEWRERMHELKAKDLEKAAKASKGDEKPKAVPEEKSGMKVVATVKAKARAKPKQQAASKSAAKTAKPLAPDAKPEAKPKPATKS